MPIRAVTSYPQIAASKNSRPVLPRYSPQAQAAGMMLALPWVLEAVCTSSSSRVWASMAFTLAASAMGSSWSMPQTLHGPVPDLCR